MIDLSFLRQKNRFDQFGQQPTDQLSTPPLIPDSGENPFGGLFQPPPMQTPQVPPSESVGVPSNSPVADTPSDSGVSDLIKMMQGAYKPKTDASDRFNQLISDFPTQQKPSLARTIGAIGINLGNPKGGIEAGQKFMDEPYNKDLAAWKAKSQPAYEAANLEREDNSINRQSAANVMSSKIASDRTAESERRYQAEIASRERIASDKADISRTRAEAYAFHMNHPDWKIDFKGPNILAVSPDGSQSANLGPTGHLSDADRIDLQTKGKEAIADIGATSREKVAGIGATSRENVANIGAGSREGVANIGAASRQEVANTRTKATGGASASQEKVRQANVARQIINTSPELADYIKFTGTNEFTMTPPSTSSFWGASPETQKKYQAAVEQIYGKQPTTQSTGTQPAMTERSKSTGIWRRVYSDGTIKYSNDGMNWSNTMPSPRSQMPDRAPDKAGYNAPTD